MIVVLVLVHLSQMELQLIEIDQEDLSKFKEFSSLVRVKFTNNKEHFLDSLSFQLFLSQSIDAAC